MPPRPLSLCCCQTKAWKAGHKGECVAVVRADTRTAAKPTAEQMRVLKMLNQLAGAADWRGVAAQERAARAVAAAVRTSMPDNASFVYCILGRAYRNLGDFNKAMKYHTLDLAIAKEVGDRARWTWQKLSRGPSCSVTRPQSQKSCRTARFE